MSQLTSDEALSKKLKRLAQDEREHMNIVRAGKNYVLEAPDLFGQETISEAELIEGINSAVTLTDDTISKRITLNEALKRLYELEKKFEQVHMNTITKVKDPSLKQLFDALTKGDKVHREELETIIAGL
jgi:rubrerythrin